MRTLLRLLFSASLVAAGIAATTTPAAALSCVDPPAIVADATSAFTGKIIDSETDRILVDVEEVWAGSPAAGPIWLTTEMSGWWDMFTDGTIPAGYTSSKTWLFAPYSDKRGVPVVNPCTAWDSTRPWGQKIPHTVLQHSVTDVTPAAAPVAAPTIEAQESTGTRAWLIGGAGTVAVLAAGFGYGLVRRFKSAQSPG